MRLFPIAFLLALSVTAQQKVDIGLKPGWGKALDSSGSELQWQIRSPEQRERDEAAQQAAEKERLVLYALGGVVLLSVVIGIGRLTQRQGIKH